jgi:hypothetical protein
MLRGAGDKGHGVIPRRLEQIVKRLFIAVPLLDTFVNIDD